MVFLLFALQFLLFLFLLSLQLSLLLLIFAVLLWVSGVWKLGTSTARNIASVTNLVGLRIPVIRPLRLVVWPGLRCILIALRIVGSAGLFGSDATTKISGSWGGGNWRFAAV